MKVIFPMAGRGSRFKVVADTNPEYQKPKPLINIKGNPMITWAVKALPFIHLENRPSIGNLKVETKDLVFLCLEEHERDFNITALLKNLFAPDINVVLIKEVTRGALETALIAKPFISNDEPIVVSDSDHYFDGSLLQQAIENADPDVKGIIPVFRPPDEDVKWSYTLFNDNHVASAVGEKDAELARSGAYANIGAYYFSSGNLFVSEAEEMINAGELTGEANKREFYVAPLYHRLINKGHKVKVAVTPAVWGLGTPKDAEYFETLSL